MSTESNIHMDEYQGEKQCKSWTDSFISALIIVIVITIIIVIFSLGNSLFDRYYYSLHPDNRAPFVIGGIVIGSILLFVLIACLLQENDIDN